VLRSILVALDETRASAAARELAIAMARQHGAELTGLAILDRIHFSNGGTGRIARLRRRQPAAAVRLEAAQAALARIERQFQTSCEGLPTRWRLIEGEGVPQRLLEEEAGRHDLVVMGRDTDFHLDETPTVAGVVQRLMRSNPRPLIVCPEAAPAAGPILAATDGSRRASQALHILALLGPAHGRPVHVLAIADSRIEADRRAGYAADLFAKHGFSVTAGGVASLEDPAELIRREAMARGTTMIALGAGGLGLRELLLGSTTDQLLATSPCALFLHR
jgi:nucleotide-binding universal stress UspA family protein